MFDRLSIPSRLKNILPFYYGWVVVGASGTAVFARMATSITTLTIFIFPLSEQLGWSRTLISGSVTAGALAALVLSPSIGWAIDRDGVRPMLVVSMVVLGLAMMSLAWATVPLTFYLAFAAARVVFHTPAPIAASTVVSRWFIRKRGRAIRYVLGADRTRTGTKSSAPSPPAGTFESKAGPSPISHRRSTTTTV